MKAGRISRLAGLAGIAFMVVMLSGFLMERYVEGTHFARIAAGEKTTEPTVVEFFSYGCPHCAAFEPAFEAWAGKQAGKVKVVREAAAWNDKFASLARMYYTLDEMGVAEKHSPAIFDAIHKQHKPMFSQVDQSTFLVLLGVDVGRFNELYNSPAVDARLKHSNEMFARAQVSGVPTIEVNGLYVTDLGKAGGEQEVFPVIDFLLSRKG